MPQISRNVLLRFFLYFIFLGFSLSSCSPSKPRADLVFINGIEPESLDPAIITGQPEGRIVMALFEGLTSRDSYGRVGPGMAERWEISSDGLTYRFYLRNNARWSNGDLVAAQDFAQSWERVLNPVTTSDYAEILYYLENAEAYHDGKIKDFNQVGVKALDSQTLEVRLHDPTPFFLDLCAFVTTYPVHFPTLRRYGLDWIKPGKLVSNGAYRLTDWRINDRIRLEKNPYYWRADQVELNTVEALPINQATTAFNFYQTSVADLVLDKGSIPPLLLGELRKRPDCHIAPILATYFYRFNVTRPPFNNPLVRKAIAFSIDKKFIVERVTRAGEPVTGSFTPPGLPQYQPPRGLSHDPDLGRKLLAQAGYPNGKNFPAMTLLYNKTEQDENIALAFQSMMKKELGIRVELRNQEWKVYLNSLSQLDYDIARSSWVGDYADPNTFLDCFVTGRGNNRTGWSFARYDQLMTQANQENNPDKRAQLLYQAETILVEEQVPIVPIFHFVGIKLYDANRLGGLHLNLIDEYPIREMFRK
ncbi:MAG: peptide ABC transporter substrate-binding protein [Verrucomicrobiae bacterium]|nr:peptide ABC transporter substrate-binding protein [Verrucomicrobiae bacterium]